MSSIVDAVMSQLTPEVMNSIAQSTSLDHSAIQAALPAALSALTAGMANTAQSGGAGSLMEMITSGAGSEVLSQIFGGNHAAAAGAVGQAAGLDAATGHQLLAALAPLALNALGGLAQSKGLGQGDLGSFLGQEHAAAAQSSPLAGQVSSFLQGDTGKALIGEAMQIGVGLLGGLFGRR